MRPLRCTVCASLIALVLGGCGESRLTVQLTAEVRGGELSKAQKTIDELYGTDRDDALLKHMEKGLVSHLQGDFAASDAELDAAAPLVDDLRGSHVGDAIATAIVNDTLATYLGRPFEHTQVDYYRTLNNLLLAQAIEGRWQPPTLIVPGREPLATLPPPTPGMADKATEKSIITARRMTINQLKETEDAAGSKRYDDDPFARVLAAVAVLAEAPQQRTESDQQFATAMLTRALKAYHAQKQTLGASGQPFRYEVADNPAVATALYLRQLKTYDPDLYATEAPKLASGLAGLTAEPPAGTGSLLVLNHVGLIARPEPLQIGIAALGFASKDVTTFNWGAVTFYAKGPGSDIAKSWVMLPIPGDVVQKCLAPGGASVIGFEIPVHAPDAPIPGPATITVGGRSRTGETVCDLDAYARSELKDHQPALLLKTLLRVAAKQTLVALGAGAVHHNNESSGGELLAFGINLIGSALMTATESADLRAWNTLPDHIEASLIDLPAGTYPVSISSFTGTQDLGSVRIEPGRLTLVSVRSMPPSPSLPRNP
jgi:hypothetical protein